MVSLGSATLGCNIIDVPLLRDDKTHSGPLLYEHCRFIQLENIQGDKGHPKEREGMNGVVKIRGISKNQSKVWYGLQTSVLYCK